MVKLLRSFELRRDHHHVPLPPGAQRLLAFLALQGCLLKRVYVAGTLWIDYSQESANANLRTALWRVRQLPYPLIDTTTTHLSLAAEVAVDLHEDGGDCETDHNGAVLTVAPRISRGSCSLATCCPTGMTTGW